MSEIRALSFNPNDAVAGGLLDDADVLIKEARICLWDYNGKANTTCAIRVAFVDGEDKQHEQYYSVGAPDRYVPSEDGRQVLPVAGATGLNTNSNAFRFIKSLVDSGVPADFIATDIGKLDGMRVHVKQFAQEKRAGLNQPQDDKNRTSLLVTKLIAMPGEKPKGGTTKAATASKPATGAPASAPATTNAPSAEVADKAVIYIAQVLAANGGSVSRAKISQLVFQAANAAKDGDKQALTKIVYDEKFLNDNAGRPVASGDEMVSFNYDAANKTLSAAA
jgi:hypothetical protein